MLKPYYSNHAPRLIVFTKKPAIALSYPEYRTPSLQYTLATPYPDYRTPPPLYSTLAVYDGAPLPEDGVRLFGPRLPVREMLLRCAVATTRRFLQLDGGFCGERVGYGSRVNIEIETPVVLQSGHHCQHNSTTTVIERYQTYRTPPSSRTSCLLRPSLRWAISLTRRDSGRALAVLMLVSCSCV